MSLIRPCHARAHSFVVNVIEKKATRDARLPLYGIPPLHQPGTVRLPSEPGCRSEGEGANQAPGESTDTSRRRLCRALAPLFV